MNGFSSFFGIQESGGNPTQGGFFTPLNNSSQQNAKISNKLKSLHQKLQKVSNNNLTSYQGFTDGRL
jgi:hypothetical protein